MWSGITSSGNNIDLIFYTQNKNIYTKYRISKCYGIVLSPPINDMTVHIPDTAIRNNRKERR